MGAPDLKRSDRVARCSCGAVRPSAHHQHLPFFQYRGEGSRDALMACKHCRCFECAHDPREDGRYPSVIGEPHAFEPHGAFEFDSYYCGHGGWE